MIFYLGTHMPNFVELVNIPWFVSVSRVIKRKSRLSGNWIMDSGGFIQISKHGGYKISEQDYLKCIEFQNPKLAFCQDWMCEPSIIKKTGLSVKEHQERTLENYLSMSSFTDKIRPVLQGWKYTDYMDHVKMYQLFGVGTVCVRNGSPEITNEIFKSILSEQPRIKLHGFGIKTDSLKYSKDLLWSADSMAWSIHGRYEKYCLNCNTKNCANCLEFALMWRKSILQR